MFLRAAPNAIADDSHHTPGRSAVSTIAAHVLACGLVAATFGCGGGDDEGTTNVLPTQAASEESGASTGGTVTAGVDSSGGEAQGIPAAYRFECIDIQTLGDADGDAFQANLLEDTWNSDIDDFKLNIMFEVQERDDSAGTAKVGIRSGIGTNAGDMCSEPSSESAIIDVTYAADSALWVPSTADGSCSAAAPAGTATDGSYEMELPEDVLVYIYAQDTDGTVFNCTADDALPDAVPVRAVQAQLTASPDGSTIAGTLSGCLLGTEAQALCSCLGQCNPAMANENCGGCPEGSVPLRDLLIGVNPSTHCSDLIGAEAYDLTLGFSATALPAVPTQCGGG